MLFAVAVRLRLDSLALCLFGQRFRLDTGTFKIADVFGFSCSGRFSVKAPTLFAGSSPLVFSKRFSFHTVCLVLFVSDKVCRS